MPGSHPKAVRLPPSASPHRGLRWLDAGFTHTLVETRKGPRLHPGLHGLDLRDWLLLEDGAAAGNAHADQTAVKAAAFADVARRADVLQDDDVSTHGAQAEALAMVHDWLRVCHPGRADGDAPPSGSTSPLEAAALAVPEDLVLMRKDAARGTYRAVAAAVVFSFGALPARIRGQYDMAALHEKVRAEAARQSGTLRVHHRAPLSSRPCMHARTHSYACARARDGRWTATRRSSMRRSSAS